MTPMLSVSSGPAADISPRRCFLPDARLLRLYGAIVLPGGPAADLAIDAPIGTARLLERLLHLRNGRCGRPLDALGGKFGSSSSAEATTVELTFSAEDAPAVFALAERWLTEPHHPDDIALALRLVARESAGRPDITREALGHALRALSGAPHLAAVTDPDRLETSPASLALRQHQLLDLGWVTAAVGPGEALWPPAPPGRRRSWRPPAPPPGSSGGVVERGSGSARSVVCAARALPGAGAHLDSGELAVAALEYGQSLPAQQRLSSLVGPAKPAVHHRRYGEVAFLAVVVPAEPGREAPIAGALSDLFRTLPDTPPGQARRRLIHRLELLADTPRRRVAEEGLCALYGAPAPLERLRWARNCSDEELRSTLSRVAAAPAAMVTVRR